MVVCTSYSLPSKNNVLAIDDMENAWYFNLRRCRNCSYLAVMYLVRPW